MAAQALVNLGASLGTVRVSEDLLPSRETMHAHIARLGANVRGQLKRELAAQPSIAVAVHLWSDPPDEQVYRAVTAHYVADDWEYCSRLLAVAPLPAAAPGENGGDGSGHRLGIWRGGGLWLLGVTGAPTTRETEK